MMLAAPAVARAAGGHPVWHLLVVAVVSVVLFAGIKVWEWWRSYSARARPGWDTSRARPWARPSSPLVVGVALASAGCGVIHAAAGPAHFHEAVAFGVFFIVASALQAAWALLVLRRADRALLAIGAAGNAAVLGLWVLTRTSGLPLGPELWRPEVVAPPDLLASLLEVTVVLGASWLLLRPTHAGRGPRGAPAQ